MKIVQVESFAVAGREARTSNAQEMSGGGVIGKMWSTGVPVGSIAVVYSGYESDKDGEYDYLLGTKVKDDETISKEMAHRTIAAGPYLHMSFAGPISPEAVMGLWRHVWEAEHIGTIQRAYKTDFELYGESGFDLYVGLKA